VDRLDFSVGDLDGSSIAIEGFITNEDGPYEVRVSKAYNIDSASVTRSPISVKKMTISDNAGNSEDLIPVSKGIYQTSKTGIHGEVGRAYVLRVELLDGRVYETIPDTMSVSGSVDKIDTQIVNYDNEQGVKTYGFDVFFDSQSGENTTNRFVWKTTFVTEVHTQPWDYTVKCGFQNRYDCPAPLYCSGYELDTPTGTVVTSRPPRPCTCCNCWITNDPPIPIVSDNLTSGKGNGTFSHLYAARVPVTGLTMQYGTQVLIRQFSLSQRAYDFWKLFRAQKDAVTNMFQPVNGKLVGNWVQVEGNPGPIQGLFYASGVHSKKITLSHEDVPGTITVPRLQLYPDDCREAFFNASNVKPDFWDVQ